MNEPYTAEKDAGRKWIAFPGKVPVCQDCGTDWQPVRRGECIRCGSDAGPLNNDEPCVECDGSGWSKQGWTDKNGFSEDQYGPCRCTRVLPPAKSQGDAL